MTILAIKRGEPDFEGVRFCLRVYNRKTTTCWSTNILYIEGRKTIMATDGHRLHTHKLKKSVDSNIYIATKNERGVVLLSDETHNIIAPKNWKAIVQRNKNWICLENINLQFAMRDTERFSVEYTKLVRSMKYNLPKNYRKLVERLGINVPKAQLDSNYTLNIGYVKSLIGYKYKVYLGINNTKFSQEVYPIIFEGEEGNKAAIMPCVM